MQALEAASSSQQGPASTSSQPQDLSARQQSPQEASTTAPAGRPQPPMPEQLGHVVTPNSTQPRPQSILTRPGPNTDAFGTSEATSRQASPSPASQQVPATQSERGAPSGQVSFESCAVKCTRQEEMACSLRVLNHLWLCKMSWRWHCLEVIEDIARSLPGNAWELSCSSSHMVMWGK